MYVNKINNDNKYFTQVNEILTYSQSKINEIKDIISKLRSKNVGVVISDHNAQATMDICDNISVINNGEIIASGNSSSIKENNTVQQIYLGENLT